MKLFNLHPLVASGVINTLLYALYLFVPCSGAFCAEGVIMQPANLLNLSAIQFGLFFNWNNPDYFSSFDNFLLHFPPTFGAFLIVWAIVLIPFWLHLVPDRKHDTVKVQQTSKPVTKSKSKKK